MGANHRQARVLGAFAALVVGCTGTSTDNPYDANHDGEENAGGQENCEARRTVELGLDETSELGFAASDVLANVAGTREESLNWHPLTHASYGPESGEQTLSLGVRATGKARFVDYEPKMGNGAELEAPICDDLLEIPVDVTLESGGGALDEAFSTTLTAKSAELGRVYYRLKAEDIQGSLTVDGQDGYSLRELSILIEATRFGVSGEITPSLEKESSDAVSQAPTTALASWGGQGCQQGGNAVPSDAEVAGFSADEALELVGAHGAASAQWSGGDATTLTLTFEPGVEGACAVLEASDFAPPGSDGSVGTLRVSGTLMASSADGALAAEWPGTLTALPGDDVLASVSFENAGAEDGSGFLEVDSSGYDSVSVRALLSLSAAGSWSGEITLFGFVNASCSTEAQEEPGGGSSSPGCPGAEQHELAQLTMTD